MNRESFIYISAGILLVVLLIAYPFLLHSSEESITITVTHKERVTSKIGDSVESYYLIFTEVETFSLKDSMVYGQFRSSDLYGRIKIGETYDVTVVGWRVSLMSSYRNIVGVGLRD